MILRYIQIILFIVHIGFCRQDISNGFVGDGLMSDVDAADADGANMKLCTPKPNITTVSALSACSLHVEWKVDNSRRATENISSFEIHWKETDNEDDNETSLKVDSGVNEADITNLLGSTSYDIHVSANFNKNDKCYSEPVTNSTEREVPPEDVMILEDSITASKLFLEWSSPNTSCSFNAYLILWSGHVLWQPQKITFGTEVSHKNTYIMTNLIPCSNYHICVCTVTNHTRGEPNCVNGTTLEGEPGAPLEVSVNLLDSWSVKIKWKEPPDMNGYLHDYLVTWKLSSQNKDPKSLNTNETSVKIEDLSACGLYNFTVQASTNEERYGNPALSNAEMGPEVPPSVTFFDNGLVSARSAELKWGAPNTECKILSYELQGTGEVQWMNETTDTSQEVSGDVTSFVFEDLIPFTKYKFKIVASTESGLGNDASRDVQTAEDVPEKPSSLQIVDIMKTSFTVTWRSPNNTNGILKGFTVKWNIYDVYVNASQDPTYLYNYTVKHLTTSTVYNISVSAETSAGYGQPADTSTLTDRSSVGIIFGVIIPLIAACLLGLAYVYREKPKGRIQRAEPARYIDNVSVATTTILPLQHLRTHINDKHSVKNEFDSLSAVGDQSRMTLEAEKDYNQDKNRYANILPYDDTRVILKRGSSNYINASYVDSFSRPRFFIAAQGPKVSTLQDIWNMIWQENVDVIVMLTKCFENGKEKCSQYWPMSLEMRTELGDFFIHNISEEATSVFVVRVIEVTNKLENTKRLLQHYQYMRWPDSGAPAKEDDFLKLLYSIKRNTAVMRDQNKMLVHCSAGVGRTGTFIGLWNITEQIDTGNESVNIYGDVLSLRKQRMMMVQSQDQYLYLYKCALSYYENREKWQFYLPGSHLNDGRADGSATYDNPSFQPNQEFQGNLI